MNEKKSKLEYLLSLGKPLEQWIQNTIVDVGDYFFTFIRLFQVFSNVITNAINSAMKSLVTKSGQTITTSKTHGLPPSDGETNGQSRYDHTVHNAHGGLTPAGDAIFISMGFSMLLGALRGIYQKIHGTKNISTERLRKNLMNTAATQAEKQAIARKTDLDIETAYPGNQRYKIVSRKTRFSRLHRLKVTHTNENDTFTQADLDEAAANPPAAKQTRLAPINKVSDSPVGRVAGSLWNFNVNQSMIYWLAWYMRVVATNMKESMSRFSTSITVGVTAGVGFVFSFWKFLNTSYRLYKEGTTVGHISQLMVNPNRTDLPLTDVQKQNLLSVINYVNLPDNLKDPRNLNKADLAQRKAKIDEALNLYLSALAKDKAKRKHMRAAWIQTQFMEEEARQHAHRLHLGFQPRTEELWADVENIEDAENDTLRHHLILENNSLLNKRAVVATIRNVVIGFALPFFIFSMLAAATVVFPPLGVVVFAAGVFNSVMIMTAVGVVTGAILGLVTPAAERRSTHNHRAKAKAALSETVLVNGREVTKEAKFTHLENRLNAAMTKIRDDKTMLTKMRRTGYPFDSINVYNDDYFEKQRLAPTRWAAAKKVMKRAYEFVGGGQTGVLITRFLFLGGMIGGPLVAALSVATFGAPLIFFGIATVLAITLGGLRLAHYRQNRAVAHSNHCASHLDARIKYLENRTAELEAFIQKCDNSSQSRDHHASKPLKLKGPASSESSSVASSLTTDTSSSAPTDTDSASVSNDDHKNQEGGEAPVPVEKTEVTLEAVKPHPVSVLAKNVHSIFATRPRLQQSGLATRPSAAPVA